MKTKIGEVMTQRPHAVTPQTLIREAAQLMEQEDVGSLPVVEEGARLVGIVTDRDVAVRVVGHGLIRTKQAWAKSPHATSSRSLRSTTWTRRSR